MESMKLEQFLHKPSTVFLGPECAFEFQKLITFHVSITIKTQTKAL